ncbi:hypothetical protein JCM33774_60680 [Actinophytocola sp. KF-1]
MTRAAALVSSPITTRSNAEISTLRAQMTSAGKAARPAVKPRVRRTAPAPPATGYAPPVHYCDGAASR